MVDGLEGSRKGNYVYIKVGRKYQRGSTQHCTASSDWLA